MEDAIAGYLSYLRLEKGFSDNTAVAYQNDLTQFLDYAKNKSEERRTVGSWSDIDKNVVVSFILHLKERSYALATVARRISAVKAIVHFI